MNVSSNSSVKFNKMHEKIKRLFPTAKFDIFMTEKFLNRIVSYNKYIVVAWIGDICCGADTEGHSEPKMFTVHGESSEYITLRDVIETLVQNNFEVPCDFSCLEDIVPAVNVQNPSEPVYMYALDMTYAEKDT